MTKCCIGYFFVHKLKVCQTSIYERTKKNRVVNSWVDKQANRCDAIQLT